MPDRLLSDFNVSEKWLNATSELQIMYINNASMFIKLIGMGISVIGMHIRCEVIRAKFQNEIKYYVIPTS